MHEFQLGPVESHQRGFRQRRGIVIVIVEDAAQGCQCGSMSEDCSGLQSRVVASRHSCSARQHHGAHRSRQQIVTSAGGTQQLVEKQWVTFGALDASVDRVLRQLRKMRRELLGFVLRQRCEIDRGDRAAARAGTPARIDRIALGARGHDEKDLTVRHHGRDLSEAR
ncbi:MAG TPA: hypothetical protein VJR89_23810, partial [Polyangiales bacterium]|nr:hypothetical protein [Polyangiales bacterium]